MSDSTKTAASPMALVHLAAGYWISQALFVVAKLGIADLLVQGALTAEKLAQATDSNSDALYRILRALAGEGVFKETEDGKFALTPLSEHLRKDAASTVLPYILMFGSEWHWRAWGEFMHSVRTGLPAFPHAFGSQTYEYLANHPEDARQFDQAMTSRSRHEDPAVAVAYDWPAGIIVDIGGGRGSQLAAILERTRGSRGVLFDLPHVIDGAAKTMTGRCELEAGDFFQAVPRDGDLYLLKKVIHNWDNERASIILNHCRTAMKKDGRVFLVEHVLPGRNEPAWSKLLDLEMLALLPGGRERSEVDFKDLFASARLMLNRIIPTIAGVSLIEAVAV